MHERHRDCPSSRTKYLHCIKVLAANHRPHLLVVTTYKRGRTLSNAGVSGRKKAKVCFSDCDKQKDLSKWNKQELQATAI